MCVCCPIEKSVHVRSGYIQYCLIRPVNNKKVLQLKLGFLKWFRFIHIYIHISFFLSFSFYTKNLTWSGFVPSYVISFLVEIIMWSFYIIKSIIWSFQIILSALLFAICACDIPDILIYFFVMSI